jgi:PilZ domain
VHHPPIQLEERRSPRVQLGLPVRIRSHGPLGMRLEVTQTIDVGRHGLLVLCRERCEPGTRVWLAYPYEPSASSTAHSEIAARVMRVEPDPRDRTSDTDTGNQRAQGYRIALKFRPRSEGKFIQPSVERRTSTRVYSAVPIFVCTASGRCHGEAMTQDLSRGGVRFETSDIYAVGDCVHAKLPFAEWPAAGEIAGRIVRVQTIEDVSLPAPAAVPGMGRSAMYASVAMKWLPTA